jgi:hypothetical protein
LLLVLSLPARAAAADCSSGRVSPPAFLIGSGAKILFFGDSITHAAAQAAHAYPHVVRHVLRNTYCDLATVEIDAHGDSGSNYRRYPRAVRKSLRGGGDAAYDWVMFQDAGRAIPARRNRFENYVRETIASTCEMLPEARILLATTPPLDRSRARVGYRRRYAKSENFRENNAIVESFDGFDEVTRVVPWAEETCDVYSNHPEITWTRDGVHPTPAGHLLLAISVLRFLGAEQADLDFTAIETLHPDLDVDLAVEVAEWVYSGRGACGE